MTSTTTTNSVTEPAVSERDRLLTSLAGLTALLDREVSWEDATGGRSLREPLAQAIRLVAELKGEPLDPTRCPFDLYPLSEYMDANEHGVFTYFECVGAATHTFRAIRGDVQPAPDFSEVEP
jgi:hypothetical protein